MYKLAVGKFTTEVCEKSLVTEYTVEGGYYTLEEAIKDNLKVIFDEEWDTSTYVIVRNEINGIVAIGVRVSNALLQIYQPNIGNKFYHKP